MTACSFETIAKDKKTSARCGIIKTARGTIQTPHFVTVATGAAVRGLSSSDLKKINMQTAIINTYHLHFSPGDTVLKKKGGAHNVMDFNGVLFSDSGGFQIFSLSHNMHSGINKLGAGGGNTGKRHERLVKMSDDGVTFTSVYSGEEVFMGPTESMEIQSNIGADIIMAFDECPSPLDDYEYNKESLKRTYKWGLESLKQHNPKQALYGIVQGGPYRDLREESADFVAGNEFDGVAIGGVFGPEGSGGEMNNVLEWVIPRLPEERPRHLLGIGEITDIFEGVERGIDTFDCVMPTRVARHGHLLITPENSGKKENKFRMNLENARFKEDKSVIDKTCSCEACTTGVSKQKLRALMKKKDPEYLRLATMHNLVFMYDLMRQIREAIQSDTFAALQKKWMS